jgi:hypothetical protein
LKGKHGNPVKHIVKQTSFPVGFPFNSSTFFNQESGHDARMMHDDTPSTSQLTKTILQPSGAARGS